MRCTVIAQFCLRSCAQLQQLCDSFAVLNTVFWFAVVNSVAADAVLDTVTGFAVVTQYRC